MGFFINIFRGVLCESNDSLLYLSNSDRHGQRPQLLIECDQHTGLHGCNQATEDVVRLAQDY